MYSRNYSLWKTLLEYSLKRALSAHALIVSMLKRPKYLRDINDSNFIMFFHQSH